MPTLSPDASSPAPPAGEPDLAATEMADVVNAIFRMFDAHIDAVASAAPAALITPDAFEPATPPVGLVGAAPHG